MTKSAGTRHFRVLREAGVIRQHDVGVCRMNRRPFAQLRSHGVDRARIAECWPRVAVEGTRGLTRFSRVPGIGVWQWAEPLFQVVDRDPGQPDRLRILHTG